MTDPLMFDSQTPRVALPLLFAGQAQREHTLNEALLRADVAIQACVEGETDAPPSDLDPGQCWIVGAAPSGAFTGHAGAIAAWTSGGWRFVDAAPGWQLYDTSAGCRRVYDGTDWILPFAADAPSGGTTIDEEARAAIVSIIAKLVDAGVFAAS